MCHFIVAMSSDGGGLLCGHNIDICRETVLNLSQSPAISIMCSLNYTGNVVPVLQFIKNGSVIFDNVTSLQDKATFPEPWSSTAKLTMLPAELLQLSPLSCEALATLFESNATDGHGSSNLLREFSYVSLLSASAD